MEWYEKIAWYTALGFIVFKSYEIMGIVRNKINDNEELIQ